MRIPEQLRYVGTSPTKLKQERIQGGNLPGGIRPPHCGGYPARCLPPGAAGDTFFIASGTLHAIGAGALICEIQQSSNTTYRVYDYGRKGADGKPRELHIEKALDVTNRRPMGLHTEPAARLRGLVAGADIELLASCEYFTVYHLTLQGEIRMAAPKESFQALTVLSGTVEIASGAGTVTLAKGETAFLPVGLGAYSLRGTGELLLSEA